MSVECNNEEIYTCDTGAIVALDAEHWLENHLDSAEKDKLIMDKVFSCFLYLSAFNDPFEDRQ